MGSQQCDAGGDIYAKVALATRSLYNALSIPLGVRGPV